MRLISLLILAVFLLSSCYTEKSNLEQNQKKIMKEDKNNINRFLTLVAGDPASVKSSLNYIDKNWESEFVFPLVEMLRFVRNDTTETQINALLSEKTGHEFNGDFFSGMEWLWKQEPNFPSFYGDLKGELYKNLDPRFREYFVDRQNTAKIRLDEIVWGGVEQDGIPPLRFPKYLKANDASYLSDSDVVFGFSINGINRAYPKRILAWHEFFVDKFGDTQIACVYCTLCGTVIAYDMEKDGVLHDLGTSGFLYRSNKLMYDKATQSMWNTIEGKPVLGPLANKGIELETLYLVTTTWGEWKREHPDTEVLSLETGHRRNYDEGNAYKSYFDNDNLMFPVPELDTRLNNKSEVLVVRIDGYKEDPIAISADYLAKNPIYYNKIMDSKFVVLTDDSGANRVYEDKGIEFLPKDDKAVTDKNGNTYLVKEDGLYLNSQLFSPRLSSHRIFWFAWFNTYAKTRLIK